MTGDKSQLHSLTHLSPNSLPRTSPWRVRPLLDRVGPFSTRFEHRAYHSGMSRTDSAIPADRLVAPPDALLREVPEDGDEEDEEAEDEEDREENDDEGEGYSE
jgi:hypothetical protein